ncbi:DUF917 domain-containing protein [Bacillus sp. B1-b2]|uniref:DUF917 domain-containing protein n=1 Tax=Bacillus sp. B1-b2 TaxID=2653201 RepID=UPI001262934F|nr:DUF917 domain-containing protein [Bacillus sp. B1-b2]KAB7667742.1 DUF917 domain-containing protein [Bacillus sp. B1-b2]
MAIWIGEQEIEDLSIGAALLGTGGGGDPYLGKLMVLKSIRKNGPIKLIDPTEVPDEELVIPTAMMGAPTIMVEKIPNGNESLKSFQLVEKEWGKKAYATMPIECGGLNSTIPLVVASELGIPVVDGDGMGRAFPELDMETFNVYGVNGTPMAIHNERGDYCLLKALDNKMLEHVSRGITIRMGGASHVALYGMLGHDVKRTAIPNTISLCIELGRSIREASEAKRDVMDAIKQVTKSSIYGEAVVLFKGKVVDVERRSTDGFVRGKAMVEGFEQYEGEEMLVEFQNENLVAMVDGHTIAMVPDLISFLDLETGSPLTTEGLRYGFRVICVGIPTPSIMRSEGALQVWGPREFGYNMDYQKIEEIYDSRKVNV